MLCLPGFGTHANTQNLPYFRAFPASIQEHSPQKCLFFMANTKLPNRPGFTLLQFFLVWSVQFWIWSRRPCAQGVGVGPCLLRGHGLQGMSLLTIWESRRMLSARSKPWKPAAPFPCCQRSASLCPKLRNHDPGEESHSCASDRAQASAPSGESNA